MKKLQNNFTTPEQSKMLLELGVPADSADQVYYDDIMWGAHEFIPNDRTYSEIVAGYENISIPCWSVGRLMEIYDICVIEDTGSWANYTARLNYMNYLVASFETSKFDFSKLED